MPTHPFARLPHADIKVSDVDPTTGRWWKLYAAGRSLEDLHSARFVWSDDHLTRHGTAVRRTITELGPVGLRQFPKSDVGLTPTLLREAEEHLALGVTGAN